MRIHDRWSPFRTLLVLALAVLLGCRRAPEPARITIVRPAVTKVQAVYDTRVPTVSESAHAKLDCSACHVARAPLRVDPAHSVAEASCARCHRAETQSYLESAHAVTPDGGRGASCIECHGAHDIYRASDPRSKTHKLQASKSCARCHGDPQLGRALGLKPSEAASQYAESIHGRALLRGGLMVAPSCVDCHRSHAIQAAGDVRSSVNARNVVATCGQCHQGISRVFASGVHADSFLRVGDPAVPTCVSCHSAHAIEPPLPEYRLATDRRCGACHQQQLATHLDTYHGRAHALGSSQVAACYDCHGHHEMLAVSNPASPVSPGNVLATCRKCHAGAPANLVSYMPHADRRDALHYPTLFWLFHAMTGLLLALLVIFTLHALAWSGRLAIEYLTDPALFRERRQRRSENNARAPSTRLRSVDRFCYVLLLLAVALLVASGMPLRSALSDWAQAVFRAQGGANVARLLHRLGAILAGAAALIHGASLVGPLLGRIRELRHADGRVRLGRLLRAITDSSSPWLGASDLRAMWIHTKWFVGRGPEPRFGRFTYWEKLDYLAATLAFLVVAASGLVQWFPTATVRFLPGYVLNIAQMIHSDEALLSVGCVFTFHLLHVLLLGRLLAPERTLTTDSSDSS